MKKKVLSVLLCAAMVASLPVAVQAGGDDDVVTLRLMAYNAEATRATYLEYLAEKLPNINIE